MLIANLAQGEPDVIVLEMGDGLLGTYGVQALLADGGSAARSRAVVLCAKDPVGAWGGVQAAARALRLEVDVVTGPVPPTTRRA